MKLRRRSTTTTGGPGTGTILAVAGLTLSWLISPSSSLFSYSNSICFGVLRHRSCRCHRHGHRQSQRIVIVEARPLSTTTFHRALSIREDERGEEMELTSSVAAANSHENTMLLDTMMDSAENAAPADDCEIYSDGYNDDNGIPLELTSPMTSSSKSSSVLSNNELEEMNSGVLNSKSDSESSGGSKKEQRPSNRRMQVFAYLSKPVVEVRIICLVLLSCFLQAITTLNSLPPYLYGAIDHVDTVFVYVFATEFFARWWSAGRLQLRYLARPLVAIDAIVVILPLILNGLLPLWDFGVVTGFFPPVNLPAWLLAASSANSALLNLRLLRILKFQRVLTDENTYMNFELALGMKKSEVRPYQLQLARVVISIFTLVSVSTGLIYSAEHEVNPAIPDYFTALYFGLTTLTTVGFGDIYPVTVSGRFVVGASILAGVAIIPAQAASLAEAYLDFMKERVSSTSVVSSGVKKATSANATPSSPELYATGRIKEVTTPKNTIERRKEVCCSACGAESHRVDARFCWLCGNALE